MPRLLQKVQIAAPVNLGRLADGTEIRQEKSSIDWEGKLVGAELLMYLASFLLNVRK
ncbi:hypothetical protein J2X54_001034 [Duganella sp. 3397]|uniref:hypothetical protein n=1 Tax=Duganella sp. 3397 TaxID=2817732 RepID=UPI0028589F95|nr:hypothetical protein [Duganella sp. 3397]MDR7048586.1 hypothetical protein [Duganella sp. 3397]